MAVSRYWVVSFVTGMALVLLGCTSSAPAQPTPPAGSVARTKNVIDGTIIVPARAFHDLPIEMDWTAVGNIHITGWFRSSGSSDSEVEVYFLNDTDYQTWSQGRTVTPVYNSGRTAFANVDASVPGSTELYHLVFNNAFSNSLKTVEAEIDMKYYVPAPTTTAP